MSPCCGGTDFAAFQVPRAVCWRRAKKKVRVSMFGRPSSFGLKCFECRRQMFCLAFHFLSRGTCGGRKKDLGGIKVEVKIWQFCSVRWFEEQKMIRFCQICAYLR